MCDATLIRALINYCSVGRIRALVPTAEQAERCRLKAERDQAIAQRDDARRKLLLELIPLPDLGDDDDDIRVRLARLQVEAIRRYGEEGKRLFPETKETDK